ncbi:MAG TPA: hypothetical protein VJQ59_16950 [Candidatus Sulfotelmatobacter sp.]|nr:hypothetical protein [Candidatus Sulfotelmatobacter sp.]
MNDIFIEHDGKTFAKLAPLDTLLKRLDQDRNIKNLVNAAVAYRVNCNPQAACELLFDGLSICKDKAVRAVVNHNLAQALADLGQFTESRMHQTIANSHGEVLPEKYRKRISLGFAESEMRFGNFTTGFEAWEYGRANASWQPILGTKPWKGQTGKYVGVVCEGGYGDAFMFRRFLPLLRCCSSRVKLFLWKSLGDWCNWKDYGVDEVELVKPGNPIPFDAADKDRPEFSTSWMSIPGILGISHADDIPRDTYLLPRKVSSNGIPLIGYCWYAEEHTSFRRYRTLDENTSAIVAKELSKYARLVSLVPRGQGLYLRNDTKCPSSVYESDVLLRDWKSTTETISNMDLVVTVDTAVAHLAGLTGVPTLLVLPCRSDWKWGLRSDRTWWYGENLKLFRNENPYTWDHNGIIDAALEMIN